MSPDALWILVGTPMILFGLYLLVRPPKDPQ